MSIRDSNDQSDTDFDLFVIGGGINGIGIAADAAGRGLKVGLCERGDLGGQTSSKGSKFFHGNIRHLEQLDILLVRKSLIERNLLMTRAPHLIHLQHYYIPVGRDSRPLWKLKLLLSAYHWLGNKDIASGQKPLPSNFPTALNTPISNCLNYYDCQVDDARLVISNALLAKEKGAQLFPYMQCLKANREGQRWQISLQPSHPESNLSETKKVTAKALINASGPWANQVIQEVTGLDTRCSTVLEKGSHIIIPRFDNSNSGYILQHPDQRIISVSPIGSDFFLVGHSSMAYTNHPEKCPPHTPGADQTEIDDLLDILRTHFSGEAFENACQPEKIRRTYSSFWTLYDCELDRCEQGSRDYLLDLQVQDQAPLVTIFGGRLTTYRKVAEEALNLLSPYLKPIIRERFGNTQQYSCWTSTIQLPGGNLPSGGMRKYIEVLISVYPQLPRTLIAQYVHRYGTRTLQLLGDCKTIDDLGRHFPQLPGYDSVGNRLYEREVTFLKETEWAMRVEDLIWRRTLHGLTLSKEGIEDLHSWWNRHSGV